MKYDTTTFETPFGLFSAAIDSDGAVAATAFGDLGVLRRRLIAERDATFIPDESRTRKLRDQVFAYAKGQLLEFNLPLQPGGTDFQRRVWLALAQIPRGKTRTYAQLAAQLGTAPRAVGQANARNPICLIVPCHRVIGATGTLTGFAFGVALKERLLAHERAIDARHLAAV
jgi:methylated-DNA-[protein]-cysteine S-methyltransferase